mmetsp:Transcript_17014/g.39263  ORF Transcript_17014/g.39263 Transcript_17014/m.39263 type:complete len:794 (+) Transcript_17014:1112-3493(+)
MISEQQKQQKPRQRTETPACGLTDKVVETNQRTLAKRGAGVANRVKNAKSRAQTKTSTSRLGRNNDTSTTKNKQPGNMGNNQDKQIRQGEEKPTHERRASLEQELRNEIMQVQRKIALRKSGSSPGERNDTANERSASVAGPRNGPRPRRPQNRKKSSELNKEILRRAIERQSQKQQRMPLKTQEQSKNPTTKVVSGAQKDGNGLAGSRNIRAGRSRGRTDSACSDDDTVVATNRSPKKVASSGNPKETTRAPRSDSNRLNPSNEKRILAKKTESTSEAIRVSNDDSKQRRPARLGNKIRRVPAKRRVEKEGSTEMLSESETDDDDDDGSVHSTHSASEGLSRRKLKFAKSTPASSYMSSSLLLANSQPSERRRGSISIDSLLPDNLKASSHSSPNKVRQQSNKVATSRGAASKGTVSGREALQKQHSVRRRKQETKDVSSTVSRSTSKLPAAASPTKSNPRTSSRNLENQERVAPKGGEMTTSKKTKPDPNAASRNRRANLRKNMSVPTLNKVLELEDDQQDQKKRSPMDARSLDGDVKLSHPPRRSVRPKPHLGTTLKGQEDSQSKGGNTQMRSFNGGNANLSEARNQPMRRGRNIKPQDPCKNADSQNIQSKESRGAGKQPPPKRRGKSPRLARSKQNASLSIVLENEDNGRARPALGTQSLDGDTTDLPMRLTPRQGKKVLNDMLDKDAQRIRGSSDTQSLDGGLESQSNVRKGRRNKTVSRAESEAMPSLLGETQQQEARDARAREVQSRRSTMDFLLHDESQANLAFSLEDAEEKRNIIIPGNFSGV